MPYADLGDVRLFFDVYGSSLDITRDTVIEKPTLIVLHGTPGFVDHTLYVSFWSKFADCAQVIFLDQRGSGRSDAGPPTAWNLEQQGKDVHHFCKILGIEQPIVAGVSWGGYVAMSYGSQFPGHPAGLIFCNSEAKISPEARRAAFQKRGGEVAAQAAWACDTNWSEESYAEYIKVCLPLYAKNAYSEAELGRCRQHPSVFKKLCLDEYTTFDLRPAIGAITSPVLYLVGKEDPAHPIASAKETVCHLPKDLVQLEIIEEAFDPVYRDQPLIAEQLIRTFIQQQSRT